MATTKFIRSSQNLCYQAPTGWNGQTGACFDPALALQNGFTIDVNCAGYNAANDPGCTGSAPTPTPVPVPQPVPVPVPTPTPVPVPVPTGTPTPTPTPIPVPVPVPVGGCSISITSASFDNTNQRVVATFSSSGLTGFLQYSLDEMGIWFNSLTQLVNLAPGDHTLYVRDSGNTGCTAQRGFVVGCVPPVHNAPSSMIRLPDQSDTAELTVNFGNSNQKFRYLLRLNGTVYLDQGSMINPAQGIAGGTHTFMVSNLNGIAIGSQFELRVQIPGSLTCETIEFVALSV